MDDGLGINAGCDYFTRGEGSRNFTFGGQAVEERAPRDDDEDDDDGDEDDEGLFYLLNSLFTKKTFPFR